MELALVAGIAVAGSFLSGFLGIGGSVIIIPAFKYLPVLFGMNGFSMQEITGISSVQVFTAAVTGTMVHSKHGNVDGRIVRWIGIPILVAAFSGAFFSASVSGDTLTLVFGVMTIIGASLLLISKKEVVIEPGTPVHFDVRLAVIIAVLVGFFGGMVGAPGAFLIAPLMMTVMRIPTRITVGSTLGIVLLSSAAATGGKLITHQIPFEPASVAALGAIPAALLGSRLNNLVSSHVVRRSLAILIGGVGIFMILEELL